jgi:hypothetical protein
LTDVAETLERLIDACDQYPYHELVAYACGVSIGELEDYLRRGATVCGDSEDDEMLRGFALEYSRKDAEYARRSFPTLKEPSEWEWFHKRWPCGTPLNVSGILTSDASEALSLVEAFRAPNGEIAEALEQAGWFSIGQLDNPSESLKKALAAAGWRREQDAGPEPRPAPSG